jgi:hypothetical protein
VAVVEGLGVVVELPTAEGDFSVVECVVECVEVAVEGQGLVVTGEEDVVHLGDSMAVEQVAAEGGEVAVEDGEVVEVAGGVHRSILNLAMYTLRAHLTERKETDSCLAATSAPSAYVFRVNLLMCNPMGERLSSYRISL